MQKDTFFYICLNMWDIFKTFNKVQKCAKVCQIRQGEGEEEEGEEEEEGQTSVLFF